VGALHQLCNQLLRAAAGVVGLVGERVGELLASTAGSLAGALAAAARLLGELGAEHAPKYLEFLVPLPHRARIEPDPDYGLVLYVEVESSARRALELWLELARRLPGVCLVVKWTGETDVSREELVDYLVKIALAGGYRPAALPGFSAVEAVGEGRG
jgi:hypothetical protein